MPLGGECASSTTSLLVNYRPPRITTKSYRPRASDRTMVDNVQPRSLSCFRIRKRRHDNRMDLRRAHTPEPINMTWVGERSEHFCSFQSPEMFFRLTLPFYRTGVIAEVGTSTFSGNANKLGVSAHHNMLRRLFAPDHARTAS